MKLINLLPLFVASASAIIESIDSSCGAIDTFTINSAITEAITVATDAETKLLTYFPNLASTDDPRKAVYDPLFKPEDKITVLRYLTAIRNIRTSGYRVRIYCDDKSDRLALMTEPTTGQRAWYDQEFYHNGNPNQPINVRISTDPTRKPIGLTWTKHGWMDSATSDSSNQAHIQLDQGRIDGVRPTTDNRAFETIRKDGLGADANFNNLDYLRPLSRTILHELFHVVAGLDATNSPIVIDVPNPTANPPRAYGSFRDCISQKNVAISTVRQAECLATLAIGFYLDNIQGRAAFWSVGVVDRTSLTPANLPGTGSAKVKRRSSRTHERESYVRSLGNTTSSGHHELE